MNTPNPGLFSQIAADIVWIAFAMIGGIAKYLDTYIRTGNTPKVGLIAAHALIAGFSGYMVAQVAIRIEPDWAMVAAGMGGYLGTQGMDWLTELMKRRFDTVSDNQSKKKDN